MECSNQRDNLEFCNCSYGPCVRKGKCCECIQYHLRSGQFPACFFPDDIEKTYDRSIERFVKTYQQRPAWW